MNGEKTGDEEMCLSAGNSPAWLCKHCSCHALLWRTYESKCGLPIVSSVYWKIWWAFTASQQGKPTIYSIQIILVLNIKTKMYSGGRKTEQWCVWGGGDWSRQPLLTELNVPGNIDFVVWGISLSPVLLNHRVLFWKWGLNHGSLYYPIPTSSSCSIK